MYVKTWLCVLPLVAAGCNLANDTGDDRPATFEFITEAVFKPSCATAECHSAMKAAYGLVLDSVDGARTSLAAHDGFVYRCQDLQKPFPCGNDVLKSKLYQSIDSKDDFGNRMPLDQALSNKDIVLIRTWLLDDAPGLE